MVKVSRSTGFWAALLLLAGIAAYSNSFSGSFVFDDEFGIRLNQSIRHLWPLSIPLHPPHGGQAVSGRPLVNYSLALNYAWSGLHLWSYHLVNFLIHFLAALTLFGVIRRTFLLPGSRVDLKENAAVFAGLTSLLWEVHPLQTESVTYLVQRAESMAALFYLFTLYCFIRSQEEGDMVGWKVFAVAACAAGMACKETMITAPCTVFLFDAVFISNGFQNAGRRHFVFYMVLLLTSAILMQQVAGEHLRGGTVGGGISPWNYLLTQSYAICHYLRLAFWPSPLIFDYGTPLFKWPQVWPQFLFLTALTIGTALALWKVPRVGFVAAFFFFGLAASSSVVPIASQTMAEHHIYLSLSAVLFAVVWLSYSLLQMPMTCFLAAGSILCLGFLTFERNYVYYSEMALWSDNVRKLPNLERAHCNLGIVYFKKGQYEKALEEWNIGLQFRGDDPDLFYYRGSTACIQGDLDSAMRDCRRLFQIAPNCPQGYSNLADILYKSGKIDEARRDYETALRRDPEFVAALIGLGKVRKEKGDGKGAAQAFSKALSIDPQSDEAKRSINSLSGIQTASFSGKTP